MSFVLLVFVHGASAPRAVFAFAQQAEVIFAFEPDFFGVIY
jgi:hypothetical protein